jgi:hypothetical protein
LAVDTEEVLTGDIHLIMVMELQEEVEEEHLVIEAVSELLILEVLLEQVVRASLEAMGLLIILVAVVVLEAQVFQQQASPMVDLE